MKKYIIFLLDRKNFIYFNILFLIALYFNLNNKTLIAASVIYLVLTSIIFKSISKGLIFSFLLFSLFLVGKTYSTILIPKSSLSPAIGRIYLGFSGHTADIVVTPSHIIGIILFLWFIAIFIKEGYKRINIQFILLTTYIVFSLISALFSLNYLLSVFYWLSTFLLLPFYFFLQKSLLEDKKFKDELFTFFSILIIYESIWAIFQYLLRGPVLSSLEVFNNFLFTGPDFDQSWFRPYSSLAHTDDLANFLLPLTILFFLSGYLKNFAKMKLVIFAFMLGFFGIILTLSRSAWIALFFICLIYSLIFEKKYKIIFNKYYKKILIYSCTALLPLLILFVIPRVQKTFSTLYEEGSGQARILITSEAMNLIVKYPFFGVGQRMSVLGMFLEDPKGLMYYWPVAPHNIYLHFMAETGVISFLLFFTFLYLSIKLRTKKPKSENDIIQKKIIVACIASLIINGIFQPMYSTTMIYLVTLSAIHETI
ncbi:MAG: hypothetical protein A2857_02245 [Candidatus Levybacteria bacterium RIFCSPHIGHO2_01_FULL_36_15]|nr:MAG: hypothetical protein A2857_02245 [Candidatus Levybacteria bacterium RIFCSPHIGHO2_01_FULL_36_15]